MVREFFLHRCISSCSLNSDTSHLVRQLARRGGSCADDDGRAARSACRQRRRDGGAGEGKGHGFGRGKGERRRRGDGGVSFLERRSCVGGGGFSSFLLFFFFSFRGLSRFLLPFFVNTSTAKRKTALSLPPSLSINSEAILKKKTLLEKSETQTNSLSLSLILSFSLSPRHFLSRPLSPLLKCFCYF